MEHEAPVMEKSAAGSQSRGRFADYKGKSRAEYIDYITNWYVQKHSQDRQDLGDAKRYIEGLFEAGRDCDGHKILFVAAKMSPRVVKIARALKSRDYKVEILFYRERAYRSNQTQRIIEVADAYQVCECAEELMYQIARSNAKVLHCFTGMDADIAAVLIQRKELFPRIVHDKYDIVCSMYNDIRRKELFETDRYCLEHADALCCRGYEHEYLAREAGFQIRGRVLQFFDYCDGGDSDRGSAPGESLSLCYAGSLVTEKSHPGSALACVLELAGLCRKNNCSLHIYPNQWDAERYGDYIELEKENPYFHLHEPVPFETLNRELSQYDYAVIPVKKLLITREGDGYISGNKFIYAATNKFFDAIDAGLPMIAATPVKMAEYLEAKGVLIKWYMEDFDFDQLRRMKKEGDIYQRVEAARKELVVSNYVDELIRIYNM